MITLRDVGMFLLGITGIGALYIWANKVSIDPNDIGIVKDTWSGKVEMLDPGTHFLLSPFRTFVGAVPGKGKKTLDQMRCVTHTADRIETTFTIDFQYGVEEASKLVTQISGDYKRNLNKSIEMALSRIIYENNYTYQKLTSAQPLQPENQRKKKAKMEVSTSRSTSASTSTTDVSSERKEISASDSRSSALDESTTGADESKEASVIDANLLSKLATLLVSSVNEMCTKWGIKVENIQIFNLVPIHDKVQKQFEDAANVQSKANNELLIVRTLQQTEMIKTETNAKVMKAMAEAKAQTAIIESRGKAEAVAIEADGDAKAIIARGKAEKERLDLLVGDNQDSRNRLEIFLAGKRVETAAALGQTKGTLFLSGNGGLNPVTPVLDISSGARMGLTQQRVND